MRVCVLFILWYSALLCVGECVILTRCRLANRLLETRLINKTYLTNWICLIERVSGRNTNLVNNNKYGLFQIPEKYCAPSRSGGLCSVKCEELTSEHISASTRCAVDIWKREGFNFWSVWVSSCKNKPVLQLIADDIYNCVTRGVGGA